MEPEAARLFTILVVDDSEATVEVLERNLRSRGFPVLSAPSVSEALKVLERHRIDLVVTDLRLPGESGLTLVRHVRENLPETEVMLVTGYGSIPGAVEAVKTGAQEYLVKPFTDQELFAAVERSLVRLRRRRLARSGSGEPEDSLPGLIGDSEPMQRVLEAVRKAASSTATVLITGESGTGKEVVARAIHYSGPRKRAPFVPVSCGAIPETLLESELFGHTRGAFTGATERRMGFFEAADKGTIFLDEISETAQATQAKLLRVLQDRELYVVGSSRPRSVDVRIISATNKDLAGLVERGLFREDLYYRLNVLQLELPPLRDRGEDILLLTRHFAEKYCKEHGRGELRFSDRALELLLGYSWPGNVRELQNLVQRLVVMIEGDLVDAPDLPSNFRAAPVRPSDDFRSLADVEAEHLKNVLLSTRGNKSEAARILGIDRKTLRAKLARYGLPGG